MTPKSPAPTTLSAPVAPTVTLTATSWLMLLALATLWGGSFFWAEVALREVGPLTIVLFRVALAVPALALIIRIKRLAVPRSLRLWGAWLVMGALNNAIPFSLIVWGQTRVTGGTASILNATTAVFGAVVAGVLLRDERLNAPKLLGAAFGALGVGVMLGPEALSGLDPRSAAQLAILGAAFSYALASVWGRLTLRHTLPEVNALGMVSCAVLWMLPIALIGEGVPSFNYSAPVWGALFGLAWLATATAYLLYFAILRRAGAANLMLVTLLIPPVAAGFDWAFLGERLATSAWVGFLCIALGLAVSDGRLLRRLWPARAPGR